MAITKEVPEKQAFYFPEQNPYRLIQENPEALPGLARQYIDVLQTASTTDFSQKELLEVQYGEKMELVPKIDIVIGALDVRVAMGRAGLTQEAVEIFKPLKKPPQPYNPGV